MDHGASLDRQTKQDFYLDLRDVVVEVDSNIPTWLELTVQLSSFGVLYSIFKRDQNLQDFLVTTNFKDHHQPRRKVISSFGRYDLFFGSANEAKANEAIKADNLT